MQYEKVRANVGVTVNLGNYESLRLDYSVEAVLDFDDAVTESLDELRSKLVKKIKEDLLASEGGKKMFK